MRKNKFVAILNLEEKDDALKPLTNDRPLASLPFDCRYRLIDFSLSSISNAGIHTVALFLAGSGRSIYDHIRNGQVWDLDVFSGGIFTFSHMDYKYKKAQAHSTKSGRYNNYIDFIKKSKAEFVFVMGSRMLMALDLKAVVQHHRHHNSQITVVYKNVPNEMIRSQYDSLLSLNENGVVYDILPAIERNAKKEKECLNMNVYLLRATDLIAILQSAYEQGYTDHLSDILNRATANYLTHGFEFTGYLNNITNVKEYFDANMDMLEEKNFNALFHGTQKIYTKLKNEGPSFYSKESDVKASHVATGCHIEGFVRHSIIFRNVTIGQECAIDHSIIMPGTKIGAGAKLSYVIVDKDVTIEANVSLEGTPDKPLVIKKNQIITSREDITVS